MKPLLLATILLFSTSTFAATASFTGTYRCTGTDPYLKKNYAGTVTIKPQNTVYRLEMKYDTGETLRGTGGQYDEHLLFIAFQDPKNLKKVGLEQYRWSADKQKIGGYWVYLGQDKMGTEVCERVKT